MSYHVLMDWYFRVKHLIVTGDPYFEARLELFKVIVQDYLEAFKRSTVATRDQGFLLCGQICNFLHRLLRRIVSRSCLPAAWD